MEKLDNQQTIDSLTRLGIDTSHVMLDAFAQFVRTANAANPILNLQAKECCDIPPACWLPRCFGTFDSRACPCGTAMLRVRVNNCQPTSNTIAIAVKNDDDLEVKLTPQSVTLGPMERKWFTISVAIPEDACKGQLYELLVWVVGCNKHYARWDVLVADGVSGSCAEVEVEDCPDYVHHWYDHFYCVRPCFAGARKEEG